VLGREHHGVDGLGGEAVVADRDLRLAVGAQEVELARLAHRGEALGEAVREPDRQRHELRRLGRGEAEHDALVAGALAVELVDALALAGLERVVDALCDVGRLRADRDRDAARAAVEPDVGGGVADRRDLVAHDLRDLDVALGRHLAGDVHLAGRDHGLDRDARPRVDGEQRIEDAVGDLVADLVGVALGDRLGGEQTQCGHGSP